MASYIEKGEKRSEWAPNILLSSESKNFTLKKNVRGNIKMQKDPL